LNGRKNWNMLGKYKKLRRSRVNYLRPMTPRLIVISGKMKGTVFALSEKEVSIGREPGSSICLNDPSVSRRHCLIEYDDDNRFFIQDLESFNGIFVNGTPVNKRELKHGDQLGIGDVVVFFLLQEIESEAFFNPDTFTLKDDDVDNRSTVKLLRKDAIYLSPERLFSELPQMARVAKNLSTLLQITSSLNQTGELGDLQQNLLELIAKAIPAERGAILLIGEDEPEIISHYVWSSDPESLDRIVISKTIVDQCLKEQLSILCKDVKHDEKLQFVESLAASKIHSVLCTPLFILEKMIGVLYLDTSDRTVIFDQDHLQLLTGIAEIAARPLESAAHIENLKLENQRLLDQLDNHYKMIGESSRMKEVFNLIARIAPADSNVLIYGESGTGKELAARSIHQNSSRKKEAFVAINCATLTENLLESELFGHERGAFTGAVNSKKGLFEIADGGTIFLDEIAELAHSLQAKLLRVLQEKEIMRVGGLIPKKIDIRLIAATNRNLEKAVKKGSFRQDLYYRLNVISLTIPPLRERPEDIPLLVRFFLSKFNQKCNRHIRGLSPKVRSILQHYTWAGNVRELENVIERAVILAVEDIVMPNDLPETILEQSYAAGKDDDTQEKNFTYHDAVLEAKKKIISDALSKTNGNITEAAKSLSIHSNNLHRLIKEFNLRKAN